MAGLLSMACFSIVAAKGTTTLGQTWAIPAGPGRTCYLISKRLAHLFVWVTGGTDSPSKSENFTPPPPDLAEKYPISGDLTPHGTTGPIGSSFSRYQYPIIGELALPRVPQSQQSQHLLLIPSSQLLPRMEQYWCIPKSPAQCWQRKWRFLRSTFP